MEVKFEVYTDNNPLTYILTTAKLDATGQRWVARLADNNFSLHYRSGKSNIAMLMHYLEFHGQRDMKFLIRQSMNLP